MEFNSEQLNYFRICYVAFNLVPEGLRQVFKKEWDFLFKTTNGELERHAKGWFTLLESGVSKKPLEECPISGNYTEW